MLRQIVSIIALLAAASVPVLGFDEDSEMIIERFKKGKLVPMSDISVLMMSSERWCYNQKGDECAWSDIYLWTDHDSAGFELSNPWNSEIDIAFVDRGEFRSDRYFCEVGNNWLSSIRAYYRADGLALEGRALAALIDEVASMIDTEAASDCFDYLYRGHSERDQTITLTQRQFIGGEYIPANDAEVTLHFDKDTADNLGWY